MVENKETMGMTVAEAILYVILFLFFSFVFGLLFFYIVQIAQWIAPHNSKFKWILSYTKPLVGVISFVTVIKIACLEGNYEIDLGI